jgi:hypothetical protein
MVKEVVKIAMIVVVLTNIVVIISSMLLGFFALKKYVEVPYNYEHTLYWGLSFILLSGSFTALMLSEMMAVSFHYRVLMQVNFTFSLVWWLNTYAVMLATRHARDGATKPYRIWLWLVLVLVIPTVSMINNPILYQVLHVGLGIATVGFLGPVRKARPYLIGVYIVLVFSELCSLLSEIEFLKINKALVDVEQGTLTVGILYLLWYVYGLVKHKSYLE